MSLQHSYQFHSSRSRSAGFDGDCVGFGSLCICNHQPRHWMLSSLDDIVVDDDDDDDQLCGMELVGS